MIAWIKNHKALMTSVAGAALAAAGGLITWSDAVRQVLAALGLGVQ